MKSSLLKTIQVLGKKDRITVLGAGLASPRVIESGERWVNCRCDCDGYRPDTFGGGALSRADGRFENLNSGKG